MDHVSDFEWGRDERHVLATFSTESSITESSTSMTGSDRSVSSETFSNVQANVIVEAGQRFVLHEVSKLDNLAGLAIRYGVEVIDIKRANRMTNDLQMFAQKILRIPLPGSHPPSPALTMSSSHPAHLSGDVSPMHMPLSSSARKPRRDSNESAAMGLLRGYYGLNPGKGAEGQEMDTFNSDLEVCRRSRWAIHDRSAEEEEGSAAPRQSDMSMMSMYSVMSRKSVRGGVEEAKNEEGYEGLEVDVEKTWSPAWHGRSIENGQTFGASVLSTAGQIMGAEEFRGLANGTGLGMTGRGVVEDEEMERGRQVSGRNNMGNGEGLFTLGRGVSRQGRRSSQAQKVAEVVENLARQHWDSYNSPRAAGELRKEGALTLKDGFSASLNRASEKVTRRRMKSEEPSPSLSPSKAIIEDQQEPSSSMQVLGSGYRGETPLPILAIGSKGSGGNKAVRMSSLNGLSTKDVSDELGVLSRGRRSGGYRRVPSVGGGASEGSSGEESAHGGNQTCRGNHEQRSSNEGIASIAWLGGKVVEDFLSSLRKSTSFPVFEGSLENPQNSEASSLKAESNIDLQVLSVRSSSPLPGGRITSRKSRAKTAID